MNKRVLTVSAAYMCLRTNMISLPGGSQERDGKDYSYSPGGRGITAALTFTALGTDSIFCSVIGDDAHGRTLGKFLRDVGVDCRFIKTPKNVKTGLHLTLVEDDFSWRIVKFTKCFSKLHDDDIEDAFVTYPDALYIQNELASTTVLSAMEIAKSKRVPVFYQPCGKRGDFPTESIVPLELLILDAEEVYSYCGVEPNEYDKFLTAAVALASKITAKYYVIRIPDRGTFIYDGMYHEMVGEYPSTYLDETGSAEIYGASLVAAYLQTGGNIKKSAKCAAAAYAFSSSHRGDITSVPSTSDLAMFLKR